MRIALGNNLDLGFVKAGPQRLRLTREQRATHLFVCGSTGTGKSKLLESLVRQDIVAWRKSKCGLLVIDPHGSLYDSLVQWLAWNKVERPIVPIDLRQDDWVVAYNVLRHRPNADPAVLVNNFVQAMAYVWGESGTKTTPLFARWASNVLWALYEKRLTLLEAMLLTDHMKKRTRQAITEGLSHPALANDWAYANSLKPSDFDTQVSSTVNRLRAFLATQKLQQIFGQGPRSLDLGRSLEEGHIILVSLATEKNRVSEEDAALFATLLLSDLWAAARERGKGTDARQVKPFYVYCDEFQNFVTPTMAKNLDQARGFGLHLTLANQFPRQILHTGAHGAQVYDSLMVNARSKIVFETRGEENLRPLALDLFMGTMSPDRIKHDLYSTKVLSYHEETREIRTESRSHGTSSGTHQGRASGTGTGGTIGLSPDGGENDPISMSSSHSEFSAESESVIDGYSTSSGESVTEVPMLVPQMGKELSSRQFESIEEQVFRAMSVLHDQKQRHCVVRLAGMSAPVVIRTPEVTKSLGKPERVREYLTMRYVRLPFAIRASVAKKQLSSRAAELNEQITRPAAAEPTTSKRRIDGVPKKSAGSDAAG